VRKLREAIPQAALKDVEADQPSPCASLFRSLRFFSEAQRNALMVTGHAVRTFALHPKFDLNAHKDTGLVPQDRIARHLRAEASARSRCRPLTRGRTASATCAVMGRPSV